MKAYQSLGTSENADKMDSGLSFSEQVIHNSYLAERAIGKRELKPPSYYKGRMFEIKENLKQEIEKGKSPEETIKQFVHSIYQKKFDNEAFPTEALEIGKTNCVSSTSLILSLSEMLDYNLFERCSVGYISGKEEKSGHVFVKKKIGEKYENIGHGEILSDSSYKINYDKFPIVKPRKFILTQILNGVGTSIYVDEKEKIRYFDKALKIYSEASDVWSNKGNALCIQGKFKEGIKCFDEALRIEPENVIAQENRKSAFKCLSNL